MRTILATVIAVAMLATVPGTAGADPSPVPPSPYQIITPNGPLVQGLPTLPSVCAVQPRACNLEWNPDTGAWERQP